MKRLSILSLAFLALWACGSKQDIAPAATASHRGVYHWKTTFNPTAWEKQWMKDHKVDRLYVKLFEVESGENAGKREWKMVPVATTSFPQKLPADMEVIPVVYITVDAIRTLDADYWSSDAETYAKLIVDRIDDMMSEHYGDSVREVQLDCDWTPQTEHAYFTLAKEIKNRLKGRGVLLSGTLRLHQLREVEHPTQGSWGRGDSLPFDRSMLMCYNTGRLQDPATRNSILDFADAEPYLKQYKSRFLPRTDVAFPVYGWGLEFDKNGAFRRIVNPYRLPEEKSGNLREEWGEPGQIRKVRQALPALDSLHTIVLYHLDSLNLSRYSHEDIEEFYSR